MADSSFPLELGLLGEYAYLGDFHRSLKTGSANGGSSGFWPFLSQSQAEPGSANAGVVPVRAAGNALKS